jgi:ribosomal protein S18 acetylase RimI-like enzyme
VRWQAGAPFDDNVQRRLVLHWRGGVCWLLLPRGATPQLLRLECQSVEAGYVEISWSGEDHISDFGILIAPAFRGMGLGSVLLRALIAQARNRSVSLIEGFVRRSDLDAQPHLLRWYERHGFMVMPSPSVLTAAYLEKRLQ